MNILIDIGHPAHVHLYRNLYFDLKKKGHFVTVTTKDLESATQLLDLYNIPYVKFPRKSDHIGGKLLLQLIYDWQQLLNVKKYKIDISLGTSITNAHISKITGTRSIIMDDDDDDVQPLFVKYAHPYADCLLSPDVLRGKRKRSDTIYYAGYHELAYLHPKRFTPDPNVLFELGLKPDDKYFIMRFNSFKAHHDNGVKGLSLDQKLQLINYLSDKGKIFITTEREIEQEFEKYKLSISPDKIHSLLYFATIFLGDSQTMTSEAAVLGTPAVRCNSFTGSISYLEEEEHKYGLAYGFKPENFNDLMDRIHMLLQKPDLKNEWNNRRLKMLADKVDVTSFLVWFVENYPHSKSIIQEQPDYQYNFR